MKLLNENDLHHFQLNRPSDKAFNLITPNLNMDQFQN